MSRKNMPVIVGGAVVGVIALVLAYFLYAAIQAYGNSSDELVDANGKLSRLQRRPVFPSRENADAMEEQVVDYEEYLQGLSKSLRLNQPSTTDFSRDRFLSDYADTMRTLLNGRAKGVIITPPTGSSIPGMFGFELYRTGTPPNEKDLPRVMSQLQDIKAVCMVLYDAGITELMGVTRTEFETAAALAAPSDEDMGRSRRRRGREEEEPQVQPGALFTDPDGLFTRESYSFVFRASDKALQKVLDSLAAGQPFAVVTALDVVNPTRPVVQPPPPPPGAPAEAQGGPVAASTISGFRAVGAAAPPPAVKEAAPILPRELRVTAGQETPVISMKVDVYRFLDLASKQAEEEAE